MTATPDPAPIRDADRAKFTMLTGPHRNQSFRVHFNPETLEYTIANQLERRGRGHNAHQFVSQSTAKLTMDLVFDTTGSGQDVRQFTHQVARMLEPAERQTPAVTKFEWGAYRFQGMVETYKEALDFFSQRGVPLRATISLTLARQDRVFERPRTGRSARTGERLDNSMVVPTRSGESTTDLATRGGDPAGGRDLAASNGEENMRFPSGDSLLVNDEPQLRPPSAFASGAAGAGAGFGFGASLGGGVGASFGGGVGASFGGGVGASFGGGVGASFGGSAGVSLRGSVQGTVRASGGARASSAAPLGPVWGSRASAGVPAALGAFAGLRPVAPSNARSLSASALFPPPDPRVTSAHAEAEFHWGGEVEALGPRGLGADVGALATLEGRLRFDQE